MTRSYGGGPERDPRQRRPEPQPAGGFDFQAKLDSFSRYSADQIAVQAVRVEFGKRLVALIIDFFAAWVIAQAFSLIPFLGQYIAQDLTLLTIAILLVRDCFFQGRGIGKNLMGLQVVDVRDGLPCTLVESVKRNLIILGPLVVTRMFFMFFGIANIALRGVVAMPNISEATMQIISNVAGLYTCLAIPYESYLVYNRGDGRRFGDQFSGTAVIEAPMDFSTPIPRQ